MTSISGDLAATITGNATGPTATVAQLTDLHGVVVATVDNAPAAATRASATAYHEYGATADGSAQDRYGGLGGELRPTETFTGLRRLLPLWKQTTSPSVRLNWRFRRYRTIRSAGVQSYYGYRSAGNGW